MRKFSRKHRAVHRTTGSRGNGLPHRSGSSRRAFLGLAGGAGLAGLVGALGARLETGAAVAKALPVAAAQRSRQVFAGVLALSPRWASWNVDELNAGRDGWNEPRSWLSRILNSRGLGQHYENFPDESREPHHWGMVVDLRRCIGCHACTVACKSENNVPPGVFRTWVQVVETGDMRADSQGDVVTDFGRYECSVSRSPLPRLCNHCDNPPCVIVCPVEATFKRSDGPVLIDPTKCIGCGICVQSCPYDARYFHTVQQTADKCTFCVHRLDRGELPSCVTSCVGRARVFGDLNNPDSAVSRLIAENSTERLLEFEGTDPKVFYIDLNGQLEVAATAFDTIYPYAVGTNTNEYDDLTGKTLLQTPVGPVS